MYGPRWRLRSSRRLMVTVPKYRVVGPPITSICKNPATILGALLGLRPSEGRYRCLSHRAADVPNCTATKRRPENGSHLRGAHPAGRAREKKPAPCATHTAAEKPFGRSTTTRSHIQANTNVQPVGAAGGCFVRKKLADDRVATN